MKKLPNIITLLFLFIFALQLASLVFLVVAPEIGHAAPTTIDKVKLQVPIGDVTEIKIGKTTEPIGIYVRSIYKYAVGVVGILATVVMMFGGVLWIVAGGNAERIGNAKAWIGAALTGLILVMTSYMILYTINEDLVKFEPIDIGNVEGTDCSNKPNPSDIGRYLIGIRMWMCNDILEGNWTIATDKFNCTKILGPSSSQSYKTLCCQEVGTGEYEWAEQKLTCEDLYGTGYCEESDKSKCPYSVGSNLCCWK